jgi:peptide/nickel transport system permease protein
VLAFFGMSMPVFWTGIVFIYLFSIFPVIHLGGHAILPPGGMHSTFLRMGQNVIEFYKAPIVYQILNRAWCLVLPVIVLTLWNKQDYIRTARAKGLKERTIVYKHAFKNAIIPLITLLGLSLPGLIGGALITETVFGIDGIGRLTYNSVMGRDLFTSMSLIMVFSILVVIGNILADILYVIVDPRIKYQ